MANKTAQHKEELSKSLRRFYATGKPIELEIVALRKIWNAMKHRCNSKNDANFHHYGGRGITVSKGWAKFESFYADMQPTYKEGLWLDRLDNNKGYSKDNCAWTTPKQQSINKRNTHLFEYDGKKLTLTDWAKRLGVNRSTLSQRFYVYKWSVERTLNGC